jgi:hypothetical protein
MARNGHEHLRPSWRSASRRGAPDVLDVGSDWCSGRPQVTPARLGTGHRPGRGKAGSSQGPEADLGELDVVPLGLAGRMDARELKGGPGVRDGGGRSGEQQSSEGNGATGRCRATNQCACHVDQPQMSVVLPAIPATPKLGSAACRHMTGTRQIAPHARHGHFRSRWGCPAGSAWVCGFPEMSTQITVCPYRGACGGMAAARAADPLGERRGTCLRRAP